MSRQPAAPPDRASTKVPARTRVLRAALEAVAELGADTRVQDVAARAGMSPGHVMYYFGSRDRLMAQALLLSESELARRRDRRVAGATDPRAALDRLVQLYLPTGPGDVRWTLWAQLLGRPLHDDELLGAVTAASDAWANRLSDILAAGTAERLWQCADPSTVAYRLCRLMDGYAVEVLLGSRTRAWAVREIAAALESLVR